MLSVVTRRFEGRHLATFVPGQIVNSTCWPKEAALHRQRYLEPAPEGATVPPEDATAETPADGSRNGRRTG